MQSSAAESSPSSGKPATFSDECWSDDASASDTDTFIKTLTRIQAKGVRPDLIGSIITHYASKWLPDLAIDNTQTETAGEGESVAATWRRKKCFIETLVGILPQEKEGVPCSFLLRVLRVANAVGVEAGCREEIERRVSWQLDQASLKEMMIPAFGHGCATLLDFELVVRLVKRFLVNEARSGAALLKVAKLVDAYLGEAAVDSELKLHQFFGLATALPAHARSSDDAIYRAIDIYLKAHPSLSKQERKRLCMLIDSRKLSTEASLHAAQNERLPVRAVIQVLLSEQDKLNRHIDWSGSLLIGPDPTARCLSKRETVRQQMEIKRLKEDILMLQSQVMSMEMQIHKLMERKGGYFSWKKLFKGSSSKIQGESVRINTTPLQVKVGGIRSSNKWSQSMQQTQIEAVSLL